MGRSFKREITIADDTATSMDITLWGERAKMDDAKFDGKPVVAIKGVNVKEWNGGRNGSLSQSAVLEFQPKGSEADRIQKWWQEGGSSQNLSALSVAGGVGNGVRRNAKDATIKEMKQVVEEPPEQPQVYTVSARLATVQTQKQGETQPLTYQACTLPKEGTTLLCNRRVDESGMCSSCGQHGKPATRVNLRCRFVDFADGAWLTTFHEAAQSVLGMSADELRGLEREASANPDARACIEDRLKQRYYMNTPFQLTCRVKRDFYQGEMRGNVSCIDARPMDLQDRRKHGRKLLSEIHQMVGVVA